MAPSARQLDAMGLSLTVNSDVIIPHKGYTQRLQYQDAVKATNHAARPAGANKVLTGETYYMKKEGKTWIEKNLTWNKCDTKDTKNLSLASRPNSYSINTIMNTFLQV